MVQLWYHRFSFSRTLYRRINDPCGGIKYSLISETTAATAATTVVYYVVICVEEEGYQYGCDDRTTASHNDKRCNGVRLVNLDGSMLGLEQEVWLTRWVNDPDNHDAIENK